MKDIGDFRVLRSMPVFRRPVETSSMIDDSWWKKSRMMVGSSKPYREERP
jgi:hypothetical protein